MRKTKFKLSTRLCIAPLIIHQTLIQKLDNDSKNDTFIRLCTHLSKALNITIMAKGVDTSAINTALIDLNFNYGQGLLYGKLKTAQEFINYLT